MCIISMQIVQRVNLRYALRSQHIEEVEKNFTHWEFQHQTQESGQLYAEKELI
jgi:hypothetical protein